MSKNAKPLAFSASEDDRALLFSLSQHLARKEGRQISYAEVIRQGISSLAKQEGVSVNQSAGRA